MNPKEKILKYYELGDEQYVPKEILNTAPAIVHIFNGNSQACGVVTPNQKIMTVQHIVDTATGPLQLNSSFCRKNIRLPKPLQEGKCLTSEIEVWHPEFYLCQDYAVFTLPQDIASHPFLPLIDRPLIVGEVVYNIGYPGSCPPCIFPGTIEKLQDRVIAVRLELEDALHAQQRRLKLPAHVDFNSLGDGGDGLSGSALVNQEGHLAGILFGRHVSLPITYFVNVQTIL